MTTIVANLDCMAADRFVTYGPSYQGAPKIWIARGSIWGAAGTVSLCIAFREWTMSKRKRPALEITEDDKMEALQLSPEGLYLWADGTCPDPVKEKFYGIGSGGGYAIGAMSSGASLDEAMEIAAKWDANTRSPFDVLSLADLKGRKRAGG